MIEIVGGTLLVAIVLTLVLKNPASTLWDKRACPSYHVNCQKKLKPDPHRDEVRLLILGDFGSGSDNQRRVAAASEATCAERGCDLVLLAGDNFIQKGISCVADEQLESKFESMYQLQVPFFAILGNHDLAGNWRAQIDYSAISERWNMPGTNYDFEVGPLHINAINTTCTLKTLWRLFKQSEKPWRMGFGHHPAISSGRHGGMTWLERYLISLSGIDFFVSGHNHALEHTVYRKMDQIVSGGGGSSIRKAKRKVRPETRFIVEDFGYIWAYFTDEQASFHYFDINGKEIYAFTRNKQL